MLFYLKFPIDETHEQLFSFEAESWHDAVDKAEIICKEHFNCGINNICFTIERKD